MEIQQEPWPPDGAGAKRRARIEIYGEEMVDKRVAGSRQVGRVYLPLDWLGKRVKIIRVD